MRLLIIAPRSNLDVQSEILDAIGDDNEIRIEHGELSVRAALSAIKEWRPEGIHFAGHGDENRLVFVDGTLDSALLADAIRYAGSVKLCLFNSCESVNIALACYMAGASFAVGWQDEVKNQTAVAFAFSFWASWKMSGDIAAAYHTGREAVIWGHPGEQVPLLLNGRGDAFRNQMTHLTEQVNHLTKVSWWLSTALTISVTLNLLDSLWLHW